MAKNRNKNKKRKGKISMDMTEQTMPELPQAMDMSESAAPLPAPVAPNRVKKGVQMKRAKNVRKKKAIAKAISKNEKCCEKIEKNQRRKRKINKLKELYD